MPDVHHAGEIAMQITHDPKIMHPVGSQFRNTAAG
jgi:hypothetical protein